MADFTDIITKGWNSEVKKEGTGAELVRMAREEREREATEKSNQAATSAWQSSQLQNISGDYDYQAAYRGGATFAPGADGQVQLPNKYAAPEKHNLMGYDLATGMKYRNTIQGDRPATQAAIQNLRNSYVNQNGEAPVRDVRPLSQLAKDFRKEGRGFEDFDRNVPSQWNSEQRRMAWTAAVDADNITTVGKMLKVVQDTYGAMTAPAKFSQEETIADPQFGTDGKAIYKLFHGEEFQGGGIEAARWLRDHLRWFDFNVAHQAMVMGRVRSSDYAGIEAYSRAIERWDQTAADLGAVNIMQNLGRGIVDPTNLIGLGAGKAALMTGGRMALKQVLKRAAEAGAVAGGVGMASTTTAKGIATGKPASAGDVATSGAVGTAVGAGLGVGLSAGARYGTDLVRAGYKRLAKNRGMGIPSAAPASIEEGRAAVTATGEATQ